MTRDVQPLTAEEIEHVFAALEAGDPRIRRNVECDERFGDDEPEFIDDEAGYDDDFDDDGDGDEATPPSTPAAIVDPTFDLPAAPGLLERLLGLVALVCLGAFAMLLQGSHPKALLLPAPAMLVGAVVMGGLITSHGPRLCYSLIGICLGMQSLDPGETRALGDMCSQGRRLAYVGGFLQLVSSVLFLLERWDTPEVFGPAIGSAIAGMVAAVLVAEIGFGSIRHWIRTCLY